MKRLAAFVTLFVLLAATSSAQIAVTATSGFSFPASPNDGTNPDGTPIVGAYRIDFQPGQGCPANTSAFLDSRVGTPTGLPDRRPLLAVNGVVTVQPFAPFATLPANCPYTLSVTAVGQGPVSATSVLSDTFERFVTVTPPPPPPIITGQGLPIAREDIACTKVYYSPLFGTGSNSTFYPFTSYDRDDGAAWILHMTGDGHLADFAEPVGVPCDTPLALIPEAPYGNDYGTLDTIHSSTEQVPSKTSNAMYAGLHVDPVARPRRVTVGTVGIYVSAFVENNKFTFTFDPATSTKVLKSCWLVAGRPMTLTGSSDVTIPDYFSAAFTPGRTLSVGSGGPNGGVNAGVSLGMVGFAVAPPPDNPCAAATDYPTADSGTTLVYHPPNESRSSAEPGSGGSGNPTCAGRGIGCKITVPASSPYPQRSQLCVTSSTSVYNETLDPAIYPPDGKTYCWVGPISGGASWDWEQTPTREMAISTMWHSSGWVNSQVAAAPAPAPTYVFDGSNFNAGQGSFTCVDCYAHEGDRATSHPYQGFLLFVQTAPAGGDDVNMRNWGCWVVDTYNVTTGFTTGHWGGSCGPPMGANPQVPMVGGGVLLGCVYPHGMPTCSSGNSYLQLINPSQLAQVAQGTRDPSTVGFDEEFPLAPYMPQFGCTTCGTGGTTYAGAAGPPIADGAHSKFRIPVTAPTIGGRYGEQHLIYVFTVKP